MLGVAVYDGQLGTRLTLSPAGEFVLCSPTVFCRHGIIASDHPSGGLSDPLVILPTRGMTTPGTPSAPRINLGKECIVGSHYASLS